MSLETKMLQLITDFCYATYTLYSMSDKTESEEKMSDNAIASSGSDQGPSSRHHTMASFLKPVLEQIIMADKSMQLLMNLQCAPPARLQREVPVPCSCVFLNVGTSDPTPSCHPDN